MAQQFDTQFMPHIILPSVFVNMDNMNHFSICGSCLQEMLEHIDWSNALNVEEILYLNLVKVFYLNMDIFASNKIE